MTPLEIEAAFDDYRAAYGRAPTRIDCSPEIRRALLLSFERPPLVFDTNHDGSFWYLGMSVHQKHIRGIELSCEERTPSPPA